jgi:hypothetical protein
VATTCTIASDAVAAVGEPAGAGGVRVLALDVLSTVELDDELGFGACEVGDEWADGMLAPKPASVDLPASQPTPQPTLCIGHVLAQLARALDVAHGSA